MTYTTSDLLSSVRRRGSIPTTTNTNNVNNSTNLLEMATEELQINLMPLILSAREEFYVRTKDHTVVADTASYAIPTRASGQILRDVLLIDGTTIKSLPEIDPEDITTTQSGTVEGYYLEHNNVVLYPTPGAGGDTLRLKYFLRPSRLAATSACAQISAIDTTTNIVSVSSIPSSWSTGDILDLIDQDSPFNPLAIDQTSTLISSTDITFASLPTGLAVGDWVAQADYTPIPQVPYEFLHVLAQMTVVAALNAIGDFEGEKRAYAKLEKMMEDALNLITPRNQGEVRKIVPIW